MKFFSRRWIFLKEDETFFELELISRERRNFFSGDEIIFKWDENNFYGDEIILRRWKKNFKWMKIYTGDETF